MDSRRGFLKKVMVGIAAAPAVAAADSLTGKAPTKSDQILTRKWMKDSMTFSEFTMPVGTPPFFKREGETTAQYIMLQPFDWEEAERQGQTRAQLVDACIEAHRKFDRPTSQSKMVVGKGHGFLSGRPAVKNTHVTIVKVHGREHVMAIAATAYALVPRMDYYDVKRKPDVAWKEAMKRLEQRPESDGEPELI